LREKGGASILKTGLIHFKSIRNPEGSLHPSGREEDAQAKAYGYRGGSLVFGHLVTSPAKGGIA